MKITAYKKNSWAVLLKKMQHRAKGRNTLIMTPFGMDVRTNSDTIAPFSFESYSMHKKIDKDLFIKNRAKNSEDIPITAPPVAPCMLPKKRCLGQIAVSTFKSVKAPFSCKRIISYEKE